MRLVKQLSAHPHPGGLLHHDVRRCQMRLRATTGSSSAATASSSSATQQAVEFLQGLGADEQQIGIILREQGSKLSSWQPYTCGTTLAWLREKAGLNSDDLLTRVIPCYPGLLTRTSEQLDEVLQALRATGLFSDEQSLQRLLNSCPSILLEEVFADTMPTLKLVQRSRINKYVNSGSYHI